MIPLCRYFLYKKGCMTDMLRSCNLFYFCYSNQKREIRDPLDYSILQRTS